MNFKLDEKNYCILSLRLRESIGQSDGEKIKRGALFNQSLLAYDKKKVSSPFIKVYNILNCIQDLKVGEKVMYSLFLSKAKFELAKKKNSEYGIQDIKVDIPLEELIWNLNTTVPTIRSYYNHLEELGMIKIIRGAKRSVDGVKCLFDPEIISKEEMLAVMNFIVDNDEVYNEVDDKLYEALDAYLNLNSKQQVELLKKQKEKGKVVKLKKKEAEKKEEKKEVDDTYDEFGDFKF